MSGVTLCFICKRPVSEGRHLCLGCERVIARHWPDNDQVMKALYMVYEEYQKAIAKNERYHNAHEGYAVIKEEFDELWDEIRKKESARSKEAMTLEAVQTCAMLIRFLVEICGVEVSGYCASCGKVFEEGDLVYGNMCTDCLPF